VAAFCGLVEMPFIFVAGAAEEEFVDVDDPPDDVLSGVRSAPVGVLWLREVLGPAAVATGKSSGGGMATVPSGSVERTC
jgi:hypothetical protein